jgi:myo-inositol-1(or 4)-monophosphatase
MTTPRELQGIAETIARDAGELIARRRREGVTMASTKSSSVDVVTFADQECEEFVTNALSQVRPEDGFYGEEGADIVGTSGLTWIVDPIDGTVNYLYDIPAYAVSIAVVRGTPDPGSWEQLAGVVFNPITGELFSAAQGLGATMTDAHGNVHHLAVNTEKDIAHALVATGFGYSSTVRAEQAQTLTRILPVVRDIRRAGSASLDLCFVAAGRLDAYFEQGTKPWDHAAGSLIVREAGGQVGGLKGAPEGENMLISASAGIFPEIEKLLLT